MTELPEKTIKALMQAEYKVVTDTMLEDFEKKATKALQKQWIQLVSFRWLILKAWNTICKLFIDLPLLHVKCSEIPLTVTYGTDNSIDQV